MKTEKTKRFFTLILPMIVLLLFVGLFVGSSISRSLLRKELVDMKENTVKRSDESRLTVLEERNEKITRIIGRDKELEKQFEELRNI
jgi:hypothetical protein